MTGTDTSGPLADNAARHPRLIEPVVLATTVVLSILGALIGLHMITTLGITSNTSIIGALLAMLVGKIALGSLRTMRSPHRQNIVQSAVSSATFSAANSLLTPMAVLFVFGRTDLVWPVFAGVAVALLVDAWVLYRVFGSRVFPAHGAWPPGVAAAETIKAGDKGGRGALLLGVSAAVGLVGALAFGLSMSAAGVALIGNVWALGMFGAGMLITQYAPAVLHVDLNELYIPHGLMIGAGLVALVQAALVLVNRQGAKKAKGTGEPAGAPAPAVLPDSVDEAKVRRAIAGGFALFTAGAVLLAFLTGINAEMSVPALIGWVLFAGFAALVHEVIVGLAAMHAGWFPAFAVTLIFLILGLILGLPDLPLAVLVGYCAATGPAFADMGYDFKAGWILRRTETGDAAFEIAGRRQQYFGQLVGFGAALVVVALLWRTYFEAGDIPPVAEVYASTVQTGLSDPETLRTLLLWAIPGAVIQLIGGSRRQLGVLLATGMLVAAPYAGFLVIGALAVRLVYRRIKGEGADEQLSMVGAGLIAGDAISATSKVVKF